MCSFVKQTRYPNDFVSVLVLLLLDSLIWSTNCQGSVSYMSIKRKQASAGMRSSPTFVYMLMI